MKKSIQMSALVLMTALSAGAFAKDAKTAPATLSIDSKTEVAYTCQIQENGKKRNQNITVMYGMKNGEPIVAQAKVNGVISTGLFRVADPLLNRFVSEGADGTMWTTLPAKASEVRNVDGGTLSVQRNGANAIIVEKCALDKAATAKLK